MPQQLIGAATGKPTDVLIDIVEGIVKKALKSDKLRAMIAEIIKGMLPPGSQTAKDIVKVEKAEAKADELAAAAAPVKARRASKKAAKE